MAFTKIGALWNKRSDKGPFMSGEIQLQGREGPKIRLVIFQNTKREGKDRDPDWTINLADDEPKREDRGGADGSW